MKESVLAHLDSSRGHLGNLGVPACAEVQQTPSQKSQGVDPWCCLLFTPFSGFTLCFHHAVVPVASLFTDKPGTPGSLIGVKGQRLSSYLVDFWRLGWSPFTGNLKRVPGRASSKRCTHGTICLSSDGESQPGPWKSGHHLPSSTHIESPSLLLPLKLSLSWLQPSLVIHTHRALSIHNTSDHPSQTL